MYTKGPWKCVYWGSAIEIRSSVCIGIAHIKSIVDNGVTPDKQAREDARLIAASPDLFEAAKLALSLIGPMDSGMREAADALRAAITKAES